MNAIESFFRKYDAVPATGSGPSWSKGSDEALYGWWQHYSRLVRRGLVKTGPLDYRAADRAEVEAARPLYAEIVAEVKGRGDRQGAATDPGVAVAYLNEFGRLPG